MGRNVNFEGELLLFRERKKLLMQNLNQVMKRTLLEENVHFSRFHFDSFSIYR